MPRIEPELQRLQEIKTLPSLLKYLKEDLNWPIGSDDVEEVTFDYDPTELGFDSASTAKIDEVRQLRPLTAGQKWGIFWVKFGKKQLPVQMLRRALGNLVVKKRASTKKSDKAAWHMHDLLFISAYGDDDNRHITFAHFSESEDSEKSLPVLKVLGWDDDDTLLHLKDTYKTLVSSLNWENTPTDDPEAWREHWSKAFKLTHKEVINTTKELVVELAQLATFIKKSVLTSIKAETEKGPWKKLMLAFQKTLIKDLDEDQFADVIAQTVSYGLLTARLSSDGQISLKNLVDMVPSTNPFLKELLQHFLTSAGMKGLFDVDEAGINDVVELLNRANAQAIRNDFGKKTDGEDPVIHFYEHFLGAYNKKLKVERGVFYTPQPVVSYIVRSVHELLQSEFGLEDGLADTSTWADVKKRQTDLRIPAGIKDPKIEPFVQILDPATGTATFLIEVIEVIHNTMTAKWEKDRISKVEQAKKWNTYVPTYLLPRLYAYELMMAPYAIAHMKIGLKLAETGFTAWEKLGQENRANIFLTNALEPWAQQLELPGFSALAKEAAAVNEVKKNKHFTVVIGNPPYSGHSSNKSDFASGLVHAYHFIDGKPLGERNPKWLQDDYVKFTRLGELIIGNSSNGILGYITNHSFCDNPTFRGMRSSLIKSFLNLKIIDLHGNSKKKERCPDGSIDDNVFAIQQGVAVLLACKDGSKEESVSHADLWGTKASKYERLSKSWCGSTAFQPIKPTGPFYLLIPQDTNLRSEFEPMPSVTEIFSSNSMGVTTGDDDKFVGFSKKELEAQVGSSSCNIDLNYRPFDNRSVHYDPNKLARARFEFMRHMIGSNNLALVTVRRPRNDKIANFFVSGGLTDKCFISSLDNCQVFPLRVQPDTDTLSFDKDPTHNFSGAFLKRLSSTLKLSTAGQDGIPTGLTPEDIFYYAYAVFHSPRYRIRYAEFLKIDYPRLPLTENVNLFRLLAKLGAKLVALHLMASPGGTESITKLIGGGSLEIEKVDWSADTVWINKTQTAGFKGVSEGVWNFHVGGYQVCEKWLKDRKGRKLTKDDIEHYQMVVGALSETIRLMAEIDKVIDEHGGWPGAFQASK
jgi:predicted helicase